MPSAPLLILNPAANAGRAGRLAGWLEATLTGIPGASLAVSRATGEAEELAASATERGHDRVVAIGGDGTVQEVANGLARCTDAPGLGVVPVGSGNDLARSLGLPRAPHSALAVALGPATRPLDLALARNGAGDARWFASAGGVGFDAEVAAAMVDRRVWQYGRLGYLLTTLVELRRYENRPVRLVLDDAASHEQVMLVAIANGEFYGGGMRIAPGATVDDGLLDLCVIGDVSRPAALAQLANLYRGTHVAHPKVRLARGRRLLLEGDAATRVHLDGEPFGTLPLSVEVAPGRLRVAVQGHRAEVAPPLGGA